ncbi:arylsulfatase [Flavobacterium johnsoniae]|uniref:Sulfatase n=3 Tax=Flavobacterium johnsoniae TaxID=986 RepID=A5FKV2_FLAJ1|nr:arylsulfatase [Flavobacterium johnsoniae]ABQ04175.1 sulfatase [Flavobacterium johnsoniae UW101]OXG02591.1 arylsulfatase [Flavobacterium johnsoniae UW101]WQG84030.1 arylsulfatase [Flavobacterium johnsoniae UW101]SHK14587.1 arylsulfatase [Flavobacterium johnsoniae]
MKQSKLRNALMLFALVCFTIVQVKAQNKKINILVLWGDDIGTTNISAYSDGLMGYTTPNIDRLANEGLRFLHYYGEQSCTAGRAAFLTGQHGLRTGLTKVGFPGAPMGMSQLDPSIGGIMKSLGYVTGQFGKNHVGDRNENLPTVNGFDEFFGNLYHLNAEEEPELPDYPKDPEYLKKFGPRGVLKCTATNTDDGTVDPRFGKIGKQRIEDTGPLTKKRMETVDDETSAAAIDFIKRQNAAGKPFFCWFNATRMHLRTHVRAEHRGRYTHGDSEYIDGMIEHDETIGSILKALDDLGIADNTIVVYSTDNGPHMNTWPDGAMTPFRSEKNTNWDGAFRVPCIVRWPGVIKPGTVTTELMSHNDWIPTFASIAGEPDITNKLLKGYNANGKTYKVHLDGFDQSNFLRGKTQKSARDKFFYTDDDGLLVGLREGDYKYVFAEQRLGGTMGVWAEPFTKLRLQKIFNLYQDPFERADITSNTFWDWQMNHVQLMYGAIQDVVVFAETFKEFPPRSIPPSFSAYTIMEEEMKAIKAQKYIEKNVMPKLKEEEAETKKKK